jgi:N utilization substance protein B
VLQALYAFYQTNEDDFSKTAKNLFATLDKIYDLYLLLLLTFGEIKSVSQQKIEEAKNKLRPTEEELHPNLKFVNNRIFALLEDFPELRKISEQHKINWVGDAHREMFKKIAANIRESENYFAYMNSEENSFEEDLNFAVSMFKADVANSPFLYNYLEEKSIQWIDDLDLASAMVIKTVKKFEAADKNELLPLYKDPEDEKEFVNTLLKKSIIRNEENMELVNKMTENWELERIAKMDLILMNMAITELIEFPHIPKKVTLNEYIEIAKYYSTPKSSVFINGILDKTIVWLEKEKKIKKTGRGLLN